MRVTDIDKSNPGSLKAVQIMDVANKMQDDLEAVVKRNFAVFDGSMEDGVISSAVFNTMINFNVWILEGILKADPTDVEMFKIVRDRLIAVLMEIEVGEE